MQRTLIIMVKQPRPGRVKTRLARDLGTVSATWWFRHQVTQLLRRVDDPRWRVVLAVSPDRAVAARDWPPQFPRVPQGAGDLGQRMARLLTGMRPGPVCLIGGDIPGVTRAHIWRAFWALGHHDAVFGPATDGGFWLVGVKGIMPSTLFRDVRWSTDHALSDSMATLPDARIAMVDRLNDVDTAADLP